MKIKKIITVFICLCWVWTSHAQDFKKSIEQMQEALKNTTAMHVIMSVDVYENAKSEKPFYHEMAEVNRSENNYLYHFGNLDFLMNDRYVIIVDKGERSIIVRDRNVQSEVQFRKNLSFNLDSLLQAYRDPKFISSENNIAHFRISPEKNPELRIDLFINNETHLIDKMQYVYQAGQFVSIQFKQFDIHPQFSETEFEEAIYFSQASGKIQAAEKFKGFKISDGKNQ